MTSGPFSVIVCSYTCAAVQLHCKNTVYINITHNSSALQHRHVKVAILLCALLLSVMNLCIQYFDVRPQSTPEEGTPPHQIRHAPCGQPCLHASDLPYYILCLVKHGGAQWGTPCRAQRAWRMP